MCFFFAWYPGFPHCRLHKSSPALPLFCMHRFGVQNVCTAVFFRQFHVLLLRREAELGVWWVLADSTWKHSKNGNGALRAFTALSRRAQKFSWLAFFCPPTEMHRHAHKHTHTFRQSAQHSWTATHTDTTSNKTAYKDREEMKIKPRSTMSVEVLQKKIPWIYVTKKKKAWRKCEEQQCMLINLNIKWDTPRHKFSTSHHLTTLSQSNALSTIQKLNQNKKQEIRIINTWSISTAIQITFCNRQ